MDIKWTYYNNMKIPEDILDLEKDSDWELDHIIPIYEGGTSTLDNCQILLSKVNQMKGKLLQNEFINLCKIISENNQ